LALPRRRPARRGASRSVFVNCPFDAAFRPLFRAIIFAIMACEFRPRCALERLDGAEYRLDKIAGMIGDCDWGIHDISRVEVDPANPAPRFNMPLELGIHLGARLLGEAPHRRKRALILEADAHRYDRTLSDISGQDVAHHGDDPARVIRLVRDFFNEHRRRASAPLPGGAALAEDYARIRDDIGPRIAAAARLGEWDALSFRDYVDVLASSLSVLAKERTLSPGV
jgi:hypothetical protein